MAPSLKLVKRPRPDHLDSSHPKKRKPVVLVETANGFVPEPVKAKLGSLTTGITKNLTALGVSEQKAKKRPSSIITATRKPRTFIGNLISEGIQRGFAKERDTEPVPRIIAQGQPLDQRYSPRRETTTIRQLQNGFDAAFHLEGQSPVTVPSGHDRWEQTFPFLQSASRRLQGITDMRNGTPFVPFGLVADIAHSQDDHRAPRHQPGLWQYLQRACRENGFRRLRLESATFRDENQPLNLDQVLTNESQPHMHGTRRHTGIPGTLLTLNSSEANMELYEIPVKDDLGSLRQWLVFRMSSPGIQPSTHNIPASELPPEAWIIFACPVTQVMKLNEIVETVTAPESVRRSTRSQTRAKTIARLVDQDQFKVTVYNPMAGKHLCLAFLFSKNGVPSFECSHSSGRESGQSKPIPTPRSDVPMRCHSATKPRSRKSARSQPQGPWLDVKDAMARFGCIMEVRAKSETTWTEVGAAVPKLTTLRPALPVRNSLSTSTREKMQQKATQRAEAWALRSRKSGRPGNGYQAG